MCEAKCSSKTLNDEREKQRAALRCRVGRSSEGPGRGFGRAALPVRGHNISLPTKLYDSRRYRCRVERCRAKRGTDKRDSLTPHCLATSNSSRHCRRRCSTPRRSETPTIQLQTMSLVIPSHLILVLETLRVSRTRDDPLRSLIQSPQQIRSKKERKHSTTSNVMSHSSLSSSLIPSAPLPPTQQPLLPGCRPRKTVRRPTDRTTSLPSFPLPECPVLSPQRTISPTLSENEKKTHPHKQRRPR